MRLFSVHRASLAAAAVLVLVSWAWAGEPEFSHKTRRCEVLTDVSGEFARKTAGFLDAARERFGEEFKFAVKPKRPLRVFVFSSFEKFDAFRLDIRYSDRRGLDFFAHAVKPGSADNAVGAYILPEPFFSRRLASRALDLYLIQRVPRPPAWVREGLGLVVDGARFSREKGFSDQVPGESFRMWREGILCLDDGEWNGKYDFVSVKDVVKPLSGSWESPPEVCRAEAWALCHFFLHGADRTMRDRFRQYLASLSPQSSARDNTRNAFRRAFKTLDFGRLEDELVKFVRGLKFAGWDDYAEGCKFKAGNKHGEAVEFFSKAVKAAPDVYLYAFARGICRDSAGRYDGALADFKKAVELDPLSGKASFYLGRAHFIKRDWAKTRKFLDRAELLDPGLESDIKALREKLSEYEGK